MNLHSYPQYWRWNKIVKTLVQRTTTYTPSLLQQDTISPHSLIALDTVQFNNQKTTNTTK